MSATQSVRTRTRVCSASTLHRALGVATALALSSGAAAQTKKASADAAFEAGKVKLQAGDWPGACADFQTSFELDPAVSTSIKLARCREHEQKLTSSLDEYHRALELNGTLPQPPQRRKELEELIRAELALLESRVPKLLFRITPKAPGLEVRVDGELVPETSLAAALFVNPGAHEIVVSAPEYEEERLTRQVPEAVTHEIVLTLVPTHPQADASLPAEVASPNLQSKVPAPPPAVPPQTRVGELTGSSGTEQRTVGLVVGGAGAAALGVAGYFGIETLLLVNDASSRCPDGACDETGYRTMKDAEKAQTFGFMFGGVGALLLGTGVVLHVTSAPRTAHDNAYRRTIVARLGARGASLEGSF